MTSPPTRHVSRTGTHANRFSQYVPGGNTAAAPSRQRCRALAYSMANQRLRSSASIRAHLHWLATAGRADSSVGTSIGVGATSPSFEHGNLDPSAEEASLGDHPVLNALRAAARAHRDTTGYTGVGFVTELAVDTAARPAPLRKLRFGDVQATIAGLHHGASVLLHADEVCSPCSRASRSTSRGRIGAA